MATDQYAAGWRQGVSDAAARCCGVVAAAIGYQHPVLDRMVERVGAMIIDGPTDADDEGERDEWLDRANRELRPLVDGSAFTIALHGGGEPDAKQAVELGFMILLDKPVILAVTPGATVPDHLARVADEIVEISPGVVDEQQPLLDAISRIEARLRDDQ